MNYEQENEDYIKITKRLIYKEIITIQVLQYKNFGIKYVSYVEVAKAAQ